MSSLYSSLQAQISHFEELVRELPTVDLSDLRAYSDAIMNKDSVNDRYLVLEKAITLMSRTDNSTSQSPHLRALSQKLEQTAIDLLYNDLPHPPTGFLAPLPSPQSLPRLPDSPQILYAFRPANGSYYNHSNPTLGMAGYPYARSVPSSHPLPPHSLPDPGLIFDTLLGRPKDPKTGKESFTPHPGGISALFFAFADLIIHSCFSTSTDPKDWRINSVSSYLDLSILYGSSDDQVETVRRKDGTGKLWEDVFADPRLLFMPPAACALLVLLSRNHNYIANKILLINEFGTYKAPESISGDERDAQDHEIFQRARLVNCGYFMQIILRDYVGAILGLTRDGYDWRLDPLMESRTSSHALSPRGEGNVVSVEFNLLYRWHSSLSQYDTAWTESIFKKFFGEDLSNLTTQHFESGLHRALSSNSDPRNWTFNGLKRDPETGRFSDKDLFSILLTSTSNRAGAFQARGIPQVLRVIEILGIEQARSWGTCSMNEFRKFLGLKEFSTFEEWNSKPEIAAAARSLYGDINRLELYVGLLAEEAKTPSPGAGLCPGYTVSRAILADAVCLTRGDRFLTVDFTPFNLTSWGYADCLSVPTDGSYGSMLTKLLFRTLPEHYPRSSIYAHFPFMDPDYMEQTLKNDPKRHEEAKKYDYKKPSVDGLGFAAATAQQAAAKVQVCELSAAREVLRRDGDFKSVYGERMKAVIQKPVPPSEAAVTSLLSFDIVHWTTYFETLTRNLIAERSYSAVAGPNTGTKYLDIVKDVIRVLPVRWICNELAGLPIISDKAKPNPSAPGFTEKEYFEKFSDVCQYVYLDWFPEEDWQLRESSTSTFKFFTSTVKDNLDHLSSIIGTVGGIFHAPDQSRAFLRKLQDSDKSNGSNSELAISLFTALVPSLAQFSQSLSMAVNYYLSEERKDARAEIAALTAKNTKEANEKIMGMVKEALYADPPVQGVYRTALKDEVLSDSTKVKAGERVFVDIASANKERKGESGVLGLGTHGLFMPSLFDAVIPRIVGVILSQKDIRLAPSSGKFNEYVDEKDVRARRLFVSAYAELKPWPDSQVVQFFA